MLDARMMDTARGTRAPQDARKGLWGSRPGCRAGAKRPFHVPMRCTDHRWVTLREGHTEVEIPMFRSSLPESAPSEDDCAQSIHSCGGREIATSFGDGTSGERKSRALARPAGKLGESPGLLGRALPDLQLFAGHLVVAAPDCVGCNDRIGIPGQGVEHLERPGAFLH